MKYMYNDIEGREWQSKSWIGTRCLVGAKSGIRLARNLEFGVKIMLK